MPVDLWTFRLDFYFDIDRQLADRRCQYTLPIDAQTAMNRRKSDHPGWSVLRTLIVCVPLTVFLWKNASKPDWTEVKTVLEVGGMLAAGEFWRQIKLRRN